jgi:ferric-dicitrate binding protein FerR (iron transport regulator)
VTGQVVTGRTAASSVVLAAGNIGIVRDSAVVVTTADDITNDASWRQGTLVFRDTPLLDALGTLSHWYGIELRVGDSALVGRHVSGTLAGTSQAEALSALRAILNVDMTFGETPDHTPVITLVRQAVTPTRGHERRDRRNYSYPSAEVGR